MLTPSTIILPFLTSTERTSGSDIVKLTDTYNYTEIDDSDYSGLENFFEGIVSGGPLKPNANETPSIAYAIRQTSDGTDNMLIKQFELVQRTFDGIPGGVITKYYDTYQAQSVTLPSSVTTGYKIVTEAEYDEEISKMAEMYQMEADKVKELLGEKHSAEVKKDITVRKAVEFVVANAKEK